MQKVVTIVTGGSSSDVESSPAAASPSNMSLDHASSKMKNMQITNRSSKLETEFLVAPAAESRAERLIFSVWRLLGCMFACLFVDREVNFKYCHQVAYKADFKY